MSIRKGTTPIGVFKSVSSANLTNLSITPTTSSQTFNHSGYDGYDVVTCGAVTSSIDSDIKASNIKSGVNILGVNGSVVELKGETKTITPTTSQQTITPSSGKNGITSVTVNAVTSSIDPNITAANIVSGKSILGVNGSAVKLNGTTKTITPTTSQQTLAPSSPYNGYTSVTVNGVTSAIDSNIKAENIKKNVSILGVTGSYEGGGGSQTGFNILSVDSNGNPTKIKTVGLTKFPSGMFRNVSATIGFSIALEEIIFDNSAQTLSGTLFRTQDALKVVRFEGRPSSIASNCFYSMTSVTDIYVPWSSGEVAGAPWGCSNATIHYNS